MIGLLTNRVAIVALENPEKIGSIIVPDIAKTRLNQGLIKYCGPDVERLKVGMYVIFSGYAGTTTQIDGEGKLLIVPEDFIVAILENPPVMPIPGLYFRSPIERDAQFKELWAIMHEVLPGLEGPEYTAIVQTLCKKGVMGPESTPYFTANYETALEYCAMAFAEDKKWRDRVQVVSPMLREEDWNTGRA